MNEEKLIKELEKIREEDGVVSMSLAAIKNGELVWKYAFGYRDKEDMVETDVDVVYRCASVSKHVSCITLFTLVDKGLLDIDEDISVYLGYKVRNPYFPDDKITCRQIMAQTSSLTEAVYARICAGELPAYKLSEILAEGGPAYTEDLYFKERPGSYYSYNNFAYGILGTIVEKITGKRFHEYAAEAVLKPLSIRGSFDPDDLKAYIIAKPYEEAQANDNEHNSNPDWLKKSLESKKMLMNLPLGESYRTAQGNLYIVPSDLAKIEIMLMNRGVYEGIRILSPEAVETMITVQFYNPGTRFMSYSCCGLYRYKGDLIKDRTIITHGGRAFGAINVFYDDFNNLDGAICFTNGTKNIYDTENSFNTPARACQAIFKYL